MGAQKLTLFLRGYGYTRLGSWILGRKAWRHLWMAPKWFYTQGKNFANLQKRVDTCLRTFLALLFSVHSHWTHVFQGLNVSPLLVAYMHAVSVICSSSPCDKISWSHMNDAVGARGRMVRKNGAAQASICCCGASCVGAVVRCCLVRRSEAY